MTPDECINQWLPTEHHLRELLGKPRQFPIVHKRTAEFMTDYYLLDHLLGVALEQDYDRGKNRVLPLEDGMLTLLKQLRGPYALTILRTYRIKKGLSRDLG